MREQSVETNCDTQASKNIQANTEFDIEPIKVTRIHCDQIRCVERTKERHRNAQENRDSLG